MIIRRFETRDAEDVSFVIRRTMRVSNSGDYSLERLAPLIEYFSPEKLLILNRERHCLVAEIDKKVIGTIGLEDSNLVTFFVLPEYQNAGIGTRLLQAIEEIALENKIRSVTVESSLTALEFYVKSGYRKTGFIKNGTAGDQIGLEKILTQRAT